MMMPQSVIPPPLVQAELFIKPNQAGMTRQRVCGFSSPTAKPTARRIRHTLALRFCSRSSASWYSARRYHVA